MVSALARGARGRRFKSAHPDHGGLAEWPMAPVLKAGGRKLRGFDSLTLRHGRLAERQGTGFENRGRPEMVAGVRSPHLPPG